MCQRAIERYYCGCIVKITWSPQEAKDCPIAVFHNNRALVPEKEENIGPCNNYKSEEFYLTRAFCPNKTTHSVCVPKALAFRGFGCCECKKKAPAGTTECVGCGHKGNTCCYLAGSPGITIE